jgi:hypothetical protein
MARRITAMTVAGAGVVAVAFVFLHTGARADDVCERGRFVPADGLSLWPPGARCSFGEPQRTEVLFNPWLALMVLAILADMVATYGRRSTRA